jgi:hypothetical protein
MRTSTRLVLAGLVSVLAMGVLPVSSADAAVARPSYVHCCA